MVNNPENDALILDEIKRIENARSNLIDFTKYTKQDYNVSWHHRAVAKQLDRWVRGEIKRLMVFMPPRHGKTELVSRRLPAFIFGKNPNARIIAASYSAGLASQTNVEVKRIMNDESYEILFPQTILADSILAKGIKGSWRNTQEVFDIVGKEGSYRCTGIGGGITGTGADFAIIDDPIKNAKEAASPTYRESVWNWYRSVLYTRLEKDDHVLVTLTRWHEDDLAGRLLEDAKKEGDAWEILNFPAECEDGKDPRDIREIGEALWKWKYDKDRLRKIRLAIGEQYWNALYQQRPSSMAGNIFKRDRWKRWSKLPDHFDDEVMVWDLTFSDTENGSYVIGMVWKRKGDDAYLTDLYRKRTDIVGSLKAINEMIRRNPGVMRKIIEKKANGAAVISMIEDKVPGVEGYNPVGSKEDRAHAVSYVQENGCAYIPEDEVLYDWVKDYIDELSSFPNGKNDDQVDGTTMAWQYLFINSGINKLEAMLKGL